MRNQDISVVKIDGGMPLYGEVNVQGAKNSALPLIAGALLARRGETVLRNIPHIQDVLFAFEVAESLGAKVTYDPAEKIAIINAESLKSSSISAELSQKSRASVLFMGALLGRLGEVDVHTPGGCSIGARPLDYHYRGFARLGADVEVCEQSTHIRCARLKGNYVYLDMPSHTGTENLLMAAVCAQGETIIDNTALEPEVEDFARYLQKMGAQIQGIGSRTLHVSGIKELNATEHVLIPDRHDASSFAMAVAASGGKATIRNFLVEHQRLALAKLEQMGVRFKHYKDNEHTTVVSAPKKLHPINVVAMPYPGFPTDGQPCITALATLAKGKSYIREQVFDERFGYIEQLNNMGAEIIVTRGNAVIVEGGKGLRGAQVIADDLRAGFALLIAGIAAAGSTRIENFYQVERGYEHVVERLAQLGAQIEKVL